MKKKLRITFNAPLVLGFAIACALVTLAGHLTGESSTAKFFATYASSWGDPMTYVRLFTHVLGHAGAAHLVNNMAYILLLGPMLEEKYGWKDLLIVILVTALITGLIHNLIAPRSMLLGASGVVFAFILMTSFTEFGDGEIPITFILVAALYLGKEVANGLFVRDNISQLGHILGGITGAIFGYWWNKRS